MRFFELADNGLGYEQLRELALNFASTYKTENPRGFSEVGENKQLLIAIVGNWLYFNWFNFKSFIFQLLKNSTFLF